MSLAEKEQERVWFAREVFTLFVKCFTNMKLYPPEHVYCKTSLEEFAGRLRSYVKLHDVLRLGVTQDTLTVAEEAVYEEEDSKQNLAFRLYVDGLREVSICQGVTAEEAGGLARIFYQAIVDPDADSTLLLWESDFKHVDYLAINSLTEAWESPDYFSQEHLQLLEGMNHDVDQIVASLTANSGRGTYSFELTDGATELDSVDDLDVDEQGGRDDSEGDIFEIDEEALACFQKAVQTWGPDRLLRATVEHTLDGAALEPEIVTPDLTGWLLKEALELALRSHDLGLLGGLLIRFEEELEQVTDSAAREPFKAAFLWLGREENVERLVSLAKGGGGLGGPKAYCKILGRMGPGGVPAGVRTYLESEPDNKELREALLAYLEENAEQDPLALEPMLGEGSDEETVKAALFVVNRSITGEAFEQLLTLATEHPDPEIKTYATHLFRTGTQGGREASLLEALGSPKRPERAKALQALVRGRHKGALERLQDMVRDDSFLSRDRYEREALIKAVRLVGGPLAADFLRDQAQRKATLFNRTTLRETREFAAQALEDLREVARRRRAKE